MAANAATHRTQKAPPRHGRKQQGSLGEPDEGKEETRGGSSMKKRVQTEGIAEEEEAYNDHKEDDDGEDP